MASHESRWRKPSKIYPCSWKWYRFLFRAFFWSSTLYKNSLQYYCSSIDPTIDVDKAQQCDLPWHTDALLVYDYTNPIYHIAAFPLEASSHKDVQALIRQKTHEKLFIISIARKETKNNKKIYGNKQINEMIQMKKFLWKQTTDKEKMKNN